MVIVNIMMGLGNQMFQYAAGRSLALTLNEPLKVDISSYERYTLRKYELEEFFEISPAIATEQYKAIFTFGHPVRRAWNKVFPKKRIRSLPYEENAAARLLYSLFYIFSAPHTRNVYEERQFHFDKNFFKSSHSVYLKGYWMSYKYFEHCEDTIKKDFKVREEKIAHLKSVAAEINNCNSVAVHVRCTDRKMPDTLKMYGEIPASYFKAGIDYIIQQRGDVHLYIFSDDIEMAKKYIPDGLPFTFVSNRITHNAIEDFYLMTECKNIVMTNSTFSWWAAYLNRHKDSIVIAPERWYNIAPYNYQDVYYPSWIKVRN